MENIKKNIETQKSLPLCSVEELKFIETPIGKAIYTKKGRPKKDDVNKAKWNDRVECKVCGKSFIRSGRSKHKKSQFHQAYENMHEKMRNLMIKNI